ncbi:MAG: hypothetical protein Q8904_04135 [Bacteroidota bacterium]|nr:hypothetical protein [Bacteroidota bacterium]
MKIEFILSKEDLLQLQLFMASNSEQIISSRKKSRWRVPIIYALLGLVLTITTDIVFGIVFLVGGLLWLFFYPGYLAKRYVRIYKKSIEENFSNRTDKPIVLTFNDEYVETQDYQGESKLKIKEIVRIDEIRDYCFLKFTSGVGLVIPVSKLSEKDSFIEYLKMQATTNGIAYETNTEWKWK